MRVFAYISLCYYPGAPLGVPLELLYKLLTADPEITSLRRELNELHNKIKATHRFINYILEEKI
jgi:hypothetical protein